LQRLIVHVVDGRDVAAHYALNELDDLLDDVIEPEPELVPHTAWVYVKDGVARVRVVSSRGGDNLLHDDPVAQAANLDPSDMLAWEAIQALAEEQVVADYPRAAGTWAQHAAGGDSLFWDEEEL
jgi:hypothetical protein